MPPNKKGNRKNRKKKARQKKIKLSKDKEIENNNKFIENRSTYPPSTCNNEEIYEQPEQQPIKVDIHKAKGDINIQNCEVRILQIKETQLLNSKLDLKEKTSASESSLDIASTSIFENEQKEFDVDSLLLKQSPFTKNWYCNKYANMETLFWKSNGYDLFMNLNINESDLLGFNILKRNVELQYVLDTITGVNAILIVGAADSGKTTFMNKLKYDWATVESPSYLSNFKFLFAIDLKNLGEKTIRQYILDTISDLRKETINSLRKIELNVLLLLDDFDKAAKTLIQFIRTDAFEMFSNLTIIGTIRSNVLQEVFDCGIRPNDFRKRFTIVGFSKENKEKYIASILNEQKKEQLVCSIPKNNHLSRLTNCPLKLEILCYIHKNTSDLTQSKLNITNLYITLFNLLIKQHRQKHGNCNLLRKGNHILGEELLIRIGKIALNYLQQRKSYIPEKDLRNEFTKEKEYVIITRLDFLVKSKIKIDGNEITVFNAVHRTLLEFLSILYLIKSNQEEIVRNIFYLEDQKNCAFVNTHVMMSLLCGLMKYNKIDCLISIVSEMIERGEVTSFFGSDLELITILRNECDEEILNKICFEMNVITYNTIHDSVKNIIFALQNCPLQELNIKGDFDLSEDTIKQLQECIKACKKLKYINFYIIQNEIFYLVDANCFKTYCINFYKTLDMILAVVLNTRTDIEFSVFIEGINEDYSIPDHNDNIVPRKLLYGLDYNTFENFQNSSNKIKIEFIYCPFINCDSSEPKKIIFLVSRDQKTLLEKHILNNCEKDTLNIYCASMQEKNIVSIHRLSC